MFITIEGVDASGKSTQAKLLADFFQKKAANVLLTREPGGCEVSEEIRAILLNPEFVLTDKTELLLMLAARAEHFEVKIKPALEQGAVVICERFIDSTLAYQGYARDMNFSLIRTLNSFVTEGIAPDLTLFFDLNPEITFARLEKTRFEKDRMELAGLEFQKKVREGFLEIAKTDSERFKIIDVSNLSIEEVFEKVKKNVIF